MLIVNVHVNCGRIGPRPDTVIFIVSQRATVTIWRGEMGNEFTGHDIARVRKYIVSSLTLGRYGSLELLELLAIVQRDHSLKLNLERQNRYQSKKKGDHCS